MRAMLSTTFQSLQVRNYRLFATGQLIKLIGVWMMFIAQDWLVLELSDNSPTALGVVTALQFIPVLLLTLSPASSPTGTTSACCCSSRTPFWTVLALGMSPAGRSPAWCELWHVFVFAALLGIANAIETPVRQAFVSELVGTPLLPNALSLSTPPRSTPPGSSARPWPAWPSPLFDVGPVFLITARQLASRPLVNVVRMRPAELHRDALLPRDERDTARVVDGLRYVWRRPDLLLPMALMSVIGMIGCSTSSSPWPRWPRPSSTPAPPRSACSARPWPSGALGGALAGTGRRSRPRSWLVLGAAIGFAGFGTAGRVRAGVLAGGDAAGADRVLHGLLRPGRQPAGAAGRRRRVPGPGDGAVRAGLPRHHPGRRAADRLGGRALRLPVRASGWAG